MKQWLWEMMDPNSLAPDDEVVEIWDRSIHGEVTRQNDAIGKEVDI